MTTAEVSMRRSIVIPIYGNEDTLAELLEELGGIWRAPNGGAEVIFVVDGSPDRSLELLRARLPGEPFPSQLISLSRNFGAFAAIRAGLAKASGEHCAVMAADLQDPPDLIRHFFEALDAGTCDVVFGQRIARSDPPLTRLASSFYWLLYRRYIEPDVPKGGVDVFACNSRVRQALLALHENRSSLISQLFWLGFRRKFVPYARRPRGGASRSAWTLAKRWRYMTDSVFSFTQLPIAVLRRLGLAGLALSLGASAVVAGAWSMGLIQVSGYTPIMLLLGLSSSLNILALAVVGEYVWRTFENTKNRPESLAAEALRFPGRPS